MRRGPLSSENRVDAPERVAAMFLSLESDLVAADQLCLWRWASTSDVRLASACGPALCCLRRIDEADPPKEALLDTCNNDTDNSFTTMRCNIVMARMKDKEG